MAQIQVARPFTGGWSAIAAKMARTITGTLLDTSRLSIEQTKLNIQRELMASDERIQKGKLGIEKRQAEMAVTSQKIRGAETEQGMVIRGEEAARAKELHTHQIEALEHEESTRHLGIINENLKAATGLAGLTQSSIETTASMYDTLKHDADESFRTAMSWGFVWGADNNGNPIPIGLTGAGESFFDGLNLAGSDGVFRLRDKGFQKATGFKAKDLNFESIDPTNPDDMKKLNAVIGLYDGMRQGASLAARDSGYDYVGPMQMVQALPKLGKALRTALEESWNEPDPANYSPAYKKILAGDEAWASQYASGADVKPEDAPVNRWLMNERQYGVNGPVLKKTLHAQRMAAVKLVSLFSGDMSNANLLDGTTNLESYLKIGAKIASNEDLGKMNFSDHGIMRPATGPPGLALSPIDDDVVAEFEATMDKPGFFETIDPSKPGIMLADAVGDVSKMFAEMLGSLNGQFNEAIDEAEKPKRKISMPDFGQIKKDFGEIREDAGGLAGILGNKVRKTKIDLNQEFIGRSRQGEDFPRPVSALDPEPEPVDNDPFPFQ